VARKKWGKKKKAEGDRKADFLCDFSEERKPAGMSEAAKKLICAPQRAGQAKGGNAGEGASLIVFEICTGRRKKRKKEKKKKESGR